MQEYRSGHNEAVLKTVRPKATGVRIPLPPPKNNPSRTKFDLGCFSVWREGKNPRLRSETGRSHTAGTKLTSRNRAIAVSASRGAEGYNQIKSGTPSAVHIISPFWAASHHAPACILPAAWWYTRKKRDILSLLCGWYTMLRIDDIPQQVADVRNAVTE